MNLSNCPICFVLVLLRRKLKPGLKEEVGVLLFHNSLAMIC